MPTPKFRHSFLKTWIHFLIQSLNRHKENTCLVGVFHVMSNYIQFVLFEEGFQLPASYQCGETTQNVNICLCSLIKKLARKGLSNFETSCLEKQPDNQIDVALTSTEVAMLIVKTENTKICVLERWLNFKLSFWQSGTANPVTPHAIFIIIIRPL